VVEIVKGLTALSENPVYEFEFKADRSFKIVPCAQGLSRAANRKELVEILELPDIQNPVLH